MRVLGVSNEGSKIEENENGERAHCACVST